MNPFERVVVFGTMLMVAGLLLLGVKLYQRAAIIAEVLNGGCVR